MKKIKHLIVRSRNTSCAPLRELVVPRTTILRLGSITPTEDITKDVNPIEINQAYACRISNDKQLMRAAFQTVDIPIAKGITYTNSIHEVFELLSKYKTIIAKHRYSSKGKGIYLFKDKETISKWAKTHNVEHYIFEKYYTYVREYRLHVTKEGCFHACRKMLKNNAEIRWHRHGINSVYILEDNPLFDRPSNWDSIVKDCVKALDSVTLDIGAVDVIVQSNKHKNPKYIILETNSAPSLGTIAINKYKNILSRIIK
jgi:carbamoylphosphate synthase large subunit